MELAIYLGERTIDAQTSNIVCFGFLFRSMMQLAIPGRGCTLLRSSSGALSLFLI